MYLFFDIDGTLTDRKTGQIVPSAEVTLCKLIQNGHIVGIVTGRAHYKAIKFAKELGIRYVVSNGGACLSIDGKIIQNIPLDKTKAIKICKEAQSLGYGVLVANSDSEDVVMIDHRFIHQVGKRKEPTHYILKDNSDFESIEDFYKIYISISKEEESKLTLLDSLPHLRFVNEYVMYQHDQKDIGIMNMMKILEGDINKVVVFGDDVNDLVMFRKEWTSIAMGNACNELKEKATFVTKSNVEDGIEAACEYFSWI